jgi:hypothetical protein
MVIDDIAHSAVKNSSLHPSPPPLTHLDLHPKQNNMAFKQFLVLILAGSQVINILHAHVRILRQLAD